MTVADNRAVWSRIWGFLEIPDLELAGLQGPVQQSQYEVISMDMRFSLNSIPVAQFSVGVGKLVNPEVADRLAVSGSSKAQDFLHNLLYMKTVKAYLRLRGSYERTETEWPEEDFIVFDGYVTGVSIARNADGLLVALQCTHWLMDMNASSALSGGFTASSGADILQASIKSTTNVEGASAGSGAPEPSVAHNIASAADFAQQAVHNLWLSSIKPRFQDIAVNSTIVGAPKGPQFEYSCFDDSDGPPENTLALNRITDSDVSHFDNEAFAAVPLLQMVDIIRDTPDLSYGVETTVADMTNDGALGAVTMWDALLRFGRAFRFTIVPLVETAVCAPIIGCLTNAWHKTIKADEYEDLRANYAITRMLRGILLDGRMFMETGAFAESPSSLGWGGCYFAESDVTPETAEQVKRGAMEFAKPPPWLDLRGLIESIEATDTIPPGPEIEGANNEAGTSKFSHTMMGTKSLAVVTPEPDNTTRRTQRDVGNLYCKAIYWDRQFLYRTAELTGKLRFDISPGSIIRVESLDGKLTGVDNAEGDPAYLFGLVTSVHTVINCQQGRAHTAFVLSHVRPEAEKDFGVPSHPLYETGWAGTVLQRVSNVAEIFTSEQPAG